MNHLLQHSEVSARNRLKSVPGNLKNVTIIAEWILMTFAFYFNKENTK
jgi:hypothetical protein